MARSIARKKNPFKIIIVLAILIFVVMGLLLSPLFRITQIDILGNDMVSNSEILRESELFLGSNMFIFSASSAAQNIAALPYIGSVTITRHLPDRVVIAVQEREPAANIRLGASTYILIDTTGVVLDAGHSPSFGLPRVVGLDFNSFSIGQALQVEQEGAFDDLLALSRIFAEFDFIPDVIDFSGPRNVVLLYRNFTIDFGSVHDARHKLSFLIESINKLVAEKGLTTGFIDARDPSSGQIIFRLTR